MPAPELTVEERRERSRLRWATWVAVALDLLLPTLFAADGNRDDLASRLSALTPFLTAGVGALLWLRAPWRSVGVGLVRGSTAVFLLFLVLIPLAFVAVSSLGLM